MYVCTYEKAQTCTNPFYKYIDPENNMLFLAWEILLMHAEEEQIINIFNCIQFSFENDSLPRELKRAQHKRREKKNAITRLEMDYPQVLISVLYSILYFYICDLWLVVAAVDVFFYFFFVCLLYEYEKCELEHMPYEKLCEKWLFQIFDRRTIIDSN